MGLTADYTILRDRFEDRWQTLHADMRYQLDNDIPFNPPIQPKETFARLTIKPSNVMSASFGGNATVQQTGQVWITIAVPAASGVNKLTQLVDDALSVFYNWTSDDGTLRIQRTSFFTREANATDPYAYIGVTGYYTSLRAAQ